MNAFPRTLPFLFFTVLLAVAAMFAMHYATPAGAGLANDSAAYIGGARSILAGTGYSDVWLDSELEPITHYPPLYPLLLTGFGSVGIDPLRAARIANILFYGANTILMILLVASGKQRWWLALFAGVLFAANSALLRVSMFAMSEPLFISLTLLSFLVFNHGYVRQNKLGWLFVSGILAGLAVLTRYSGLAIVATLGLLGIVSPGLLRNKAGKLAVFLAPAVLFLAAWLLRNRFAAGNITNRSLEAHPITIEQISTGIQNLSRLVILFEPARLALVRSGWWGPMVGILFGGLLVWLIVWVWNITKNMAGLGVTTLPAMVTLFIFVYLSAVFFSISFFDNSTRLIDRILAPVAICLVVLLCRVLGAVWDHFANSSKQNKIGARGLVIALMGVALSLNLLGLANALQAYHAEGQGYASWKWHDSPILAIIGDLPNDAVVYTNTPPAVYLVTGRASKVMPTAVDPVNASVRQNFDADMKKMAQAVTDGRAILAIFNQNELENSPDWQAYSPFLETLPTLKKTGDAILFGVSLP